MLRSRSPKGPGAVLKKRGTSKFFDIAIGDGYHRCMKVSVAEAKNKLPQLIRAAEGGEPVTICRRGLPVVEIVRTRKPTGKTRQLGTLKGQIQIQDANWWKPMTDEEVETFLAGR